MHLPAVSVLLIFSLGWLAAPTQANESVDFAKQIRPILQKNCVSCHGSTKQKAGLKLETGKQVLKGSLNGPIVVAKKSAESRLIHALKGEGEIEAMPPSGALKEEEIQLFVQWIDQGAIIPQEEEVNLPHWAFESPKQNLIPANVHPIDYFLNEQRQKKGVFAAPKADRTILLRRLYLDLVGLPPTPTQVDAFLQDTSTDAYEKCVDQLLASPQYGERWGRHFLDIWRYSDWYGFGAELRNSQKHIWNWRDWVVESLNNNKPYDRMIQEMLAGDELAPLDPNILRATGYLARSYYKFNRHVWLDDVVEHTGKAFLGITLNCCRCHDHMYDPISQEEYYRFRAIFEPHQVRLDPLPGELNTEKRGLPRVYDADLKALTFLFERGDDKRPIKDKPLSPGVPSAIQPKHFSIQEVALPHAVAHPTLQELIRKDLLEQSRKKIEAARKSELRQRVAWMNHWALQAKLHADQARYSQPVSPHAKELIRHALALHLESQLLTAEADLAEAEDTLKKLEAAEKKDPKAIEAQKKKSEELRQKLDSAKQTLAKPPSDYPTILPQYPEQTSGRRLALAQWITNKQNPLTARVIVNHVWLRHFGQPLIPTVFDLGKNGRPPTHPDLLDWLAVELMKSHWDLKNLHRLMLTSQAYQMRSSFPEIEDNRKRDPDNLLLWRMNPRPLEAEAIRDTLLHVSGLMDTSMGGPDLDFNEDQPKLRRSLYYRHAPEKTMPFLSAFDNPSPTECYRRPTTVVPQQALALVNSKLSARAAEAVTRSLFLKEPRSFVHSVYRHLLNRLPSDKEEQLCMDFLEQNPPTALVQALFNHTDFTTIR